MTTAKINMQTLVSVKIGGLIAAAFFLAAPAMADDDRRLAGTLQDDRITLAIVEQAGDQQLVRTGDALGSCVVTEIQADFLTLDCPAGVQLLDIKGQFGIGEIAREETHADFLTLEKDILDRLISDRQGLVNQIDLAPEVGANGMMHGWRVVSVREGSDVESLGLRPGDLITAVNHVAVADSVFMDTLRSIPQQGLINLSLERQQKKVELIYSLQ